MTATRPSVLPLRDYQRDALDAIHEARARGVHRQLLSMPTGSGKTVVACHLFGQMEGRGVFMVHRNELAEQAMASIRRVNPALEVGLCKAEADELGADVVVASAQTLARPERLQRLADALAGQPVTFVSDEAHHDAAPSRTRAIKHLAPALLVGLTATPRRGDRVGLDHLYDEITYHIPLLELMARDRLARLIGLRIETDEDIGVVRTRAGEFAEGELGRAVNTPGRNRLIVESWHRHAADRKRTVVFCVDVAHAFAVRDVFRAAGVASEAVLGETPGSERTDILGRFHEGQVSVLTNVGVLTEGYDEPGIDAILMARPTQSEMLYVQCVGRGARKAEGKSDCLVLDFVDVTARHSLITFPTLAGDEMRESAERRQREGGVLDLLAHVVEEQAVRERRAVEVDLLGLSPLRWHSEGTVHYAPAAADTVGQRWVVVLPEGDEYRPYTVHAPIRERPWVSPIFDRPLDLETALSLAEDAAGRTKVTDRGATWRKRRDAPTERQVAFASRLGVVIPKGATRAEVSDLINREQFIAVARRAGLTFRRDRLHVV